jgi:hypothetical protein
VPGRANPERSRARLDVLVERRIDICAEPFRIDRGRASEGFDQYVTTHEPAPGRARVKQVGENRWPLELARRRPLPSTYHLRLGTCRAWSRWPFIAELVRAVRSVLRVALLASLETRGGDGVGDEVMTRGDVEHLDLPDIGVGGR